MGSGRGIAEILSVDAVLPRKSSPRFSHELIGLGSLERQARAGKLLTPDERRRCCQLVKPATLLAWFRQLAARKYDGSEARRGRPAKSKDVRRLVIKIAMENLGWGYTKIRDALRTGLAIEIGRATVASILAEAGIEPAPTTGQRARLCAGRVSVECSTSTTARPHERRRCFSEHYVLR